MTPIYRKSLLYLVSNAFEEEKGEPILGMETFRDDLGHLPRTSTIELSPNDMGAWWSVGDTRR